MTSLRELEQWIDNDEGLYNAWRRSGLSKRAFAKQQRGMCEEVQSNVTSGARPAHYLAYPDRR